MKRSNPNNRDRDLDGVLLVDKAPDMTSHDVVAIARRALGTARIGHCGTLDPMATGLLILVIGRGTKIQDLLMSEDKEYRGMLTLGITTKTQDLQGEVIERRPVPVVGPEELRAIFEQFKGDFPQVPPMVSAIKKDGVPLYKLARKGKEVHRDPRMVHVYSYAIGKVELPHIEFGVRCSKGFYVRTYAADIGEKLGCGAHLSALRRMRSGKFSIADAMPAMDLKTTPREEIEKRILTLAQVSRLRGA
jgi:tRNA pseudouridine55 synthase